LLRRALLHGIALFAFVLAALVVSALPAQPSRALTNCETGTGALSGAELEMFELINAARVGAGLTPLVLSPGLNRTAAWKSADRSAWGTTPSDPLFAHKDSLGRMPSQRAQDCGFPAEAAENIAYGWGSPRATFDAWMASSGHRANILMPYYVTIGIGEVNDRWTTNFGIHNDNAAPKPTLVPTKAAPPPPPTPTPRPAIALAQGVAHVTYNGPAGWSSDVFASLGPALEFVYTWDAERGRWLRFVPGMPGYINSLAWVEPGREYIVSLNTPGTWE
jgi:uncharacterized protein YkwD